MVKLILSLSLFALLIFTVPLAQALVITKPGSPVKYKGDRHQFFLGVDAYARSLFKTTSNDSGTKDLLPKFQYSPVTFAYDFHFDPDAALTAQLDYTLFPTRGADGSTEETHLLFRLPYYRRIGHSDFLWKVGLVYHQMRISGQGGTATLKNGSGTATFGLPNESHTIDTIAHEIGFNYELNRVIFENSFIIEAPLNSYHRTFSFMLGVLFNIGGF